jgi:hypothetical protein
MDVLLLHSLTRQQQEDMAMGKEKGRYVCTLQAKLSVTPATHRQ